MASITSVAEAFFAACETGKGWDGCSAYCTPNATFCAQAEPLLEVKTLAQYTDWMKGLMSVLPDGRYEVKSFATDARGTTWPPTASSTARTPAPADPVPPTGRRTSTDYVYVMQFEGDKIVHMTKIWHAGLAMKELGLLQRSGTNGRGGRRSKSIRLDDWRRLPGRMAPAAGCPHRSRC